MVVTAIFQVEFIKKFVHRKAEHDMITKVFHFIKIAAIGGCSSVSIRKTGSELDVGRARLFSPSSDSG